MPKSKRAKVVVLSKTSAKGRAGKSNLIDRIRGYLDEFKTIYVFSIANLRTNLLKDIQDELKPKTRFFMGKNSLVRVAFGKSEEESYLPGLYALSDKLAGEVGVFFTNENVKTIEKYFKSKTKEGMKDFARSGSETSETVVLKADHDLSEWPTSMFERMRKLKLPVEINKGKLKFSEDYTVCNEGENLTPEQAETLKLFGFKLATFNIVLLYRFRDGEVTKLK